MLVLKHCPLLATLQKTKNQLYRKTTITCKILPMLVYQIYATKGQNELDVYHNVRRERKASKLTFEVDHTYYTSTPMFTSLYTFYKGQDDQYSNRPYCITVKPGTQCHIYERSPGETHCVRKRHIYIQGLQSKFIDRNTVTCHCFSYERRRDPIYNKETWKKFTMTAQYLPFDCNILPSPAWRTLAVS